MKLVSSKRKDKQPVSEGAWEERMYIDKPRSEEKILAELGYDPEPRPASIDLPDNAPVFMKEALEPTGETTYDLPQNCTWCTHRVSEKIKNGRKYSETEKCALRMLDPIPPPWEGDRWCTEWKAVPIPVEHEWKFPKFFGGDDGE